MSMTAGAAQPSEGAQSINRAARIMATVAGGGTDGIRLKDVALAMDLHIATARRILQALTAEAFLSFDPMRKLYTIGPAIFSYAVTCNPWYARRDTFQPALERIAARTGDTVLFSIRSGSESVCMMRREGGFPIRVMSLEAGDRRPLGVGSAGLAILAFLPLAERAVLLDLQADAYASFGLNRKQVESMVSLSRSQGFAFNAGMLVEGVYGVGIPVIVDGRAVASVSVAAIAARMGEERRIEIVETVREALADLSGIRTAA